MFTGWRGGVIMVMMWRAMTRRNERKWFFENTRREQGIDVCRRGLHKSVLNRGVAGVLSVETRNGGADMCDAGESGG